ncbi:MAG: hydantoinase/oxoprolinase family protein [Pseudomonadota bacterium]|nr:hydantoinase/oxoprolinase family protein [Pseudomonadota bacterium]
MRYRAGVDIGGTFTDIVLAGEDGSIYAEKLLTTPDDFGRGIAEGLVMALAKVGASPEAIYAIVHGTTVATNAILEGKGARTGLITTEGFRDILELRRLRIPEMYTLNWAKPPPLVDRQLRCEATEKIGPRGEVRIPLDEDSVSAACKRLIRENVAAVAVAYLHSYANPAHEIRTAQIVRDMLGPEVFVTCSSDILPEIREYERTSTTVINAYLGPTLTTYFDSLKHHLKQIGVSAPVQIMKSDGGIMSISAAAKKPAYIVESGPAAGVIGAARQTTTENYITLDMGGTTAKASMVEAGQIMRTGDYEVGAGINLSSKLVMGGGYALKLPVIDISEIGSGGGSIVSLDRGGLLKVGPKSAGALPGPVCYNQGGEEPTFTDAIVSLGFLNPEHLVGGNLKLSSDKARRALTEKIATPLNLDILEAAWGIYQVTCGSMVRAVKAVSTYRGRDPRDFSLFAFGGNGPVVAAGIARLLDMNRVVVPPAPGVFSAHGLLLSDVEHEISRAWLNRLSQVSPDAMGAALVILESELTELMAGEGYGPCTYEINRYIDLRYAGQAHELTVDCHFTEDAPDFSRLAAEFGDEHERTYGHQAEAEAVECVTLRLIARVNEDRPELKGNTSGKSRKTRPSRNVYFGPLHGQIETSVIARSNLERPADGPRIIEEYDATCVVPPGWTATLDQSENIVLTVKEVL